MQHDKQELSDDDEPKLQKRLKTEAKIIKLPAYDPNKRYGLTFGEFANALENLAKDRKNISFLIENLSSSKSPRLKDFYGRIKQQQAELQDGEVKFAFLFCNLNPTKKISMRYELQHSELVIITQNAVFSPISFYADDGEASGKEYESPFVAYYQQVNVPTEYEDSDSEDDKSQEASSEDEEEALKSPPSFERQENDFLQASHTLCNTLCLHVAKAILNDVETMANIRNLNRDFEQCKQDHTNKGNQYKFLKEQRYGAKPLISKDCELNIAEIKQSSRRGRLAWSEHAFSKEKNINDHKNQKLAHQAVKIKYAFFKKNNNSETRFETEFAMLEEYKNSKNPVK